MNRFSFRSVPFWLIATSVIVLSGCAGDAENGVVRETLKYFDLKGYMEKEIRRLPELSPFVKKVLVNEQEEKRQVEEIDFKRELKIFTNSDINRPAWSDKYAIDSVFNQQGKLERLSYQALDEKLRTRELIIYFSDESVTRVEIENSSTSSVAETRQLLIYDPKAGYSIESQQNVALMDDNLYKIEVSFQ